MNHYIRSLCASFIRRNLFGIFMTLFFTFSGTCITLAMGFYIRDVVDMPSSYNNFMLIIIMVFFLAISTGFRNLFIRRTSGKFAILLRRHIYDFGLTMETPVRNDFNSVKLVSLFEDIKFMESLCYSIIGFLFRNCSLFLGSLAFMAFLDPFLAAMTISMLILVIFFYGILIRAFNKKKKINNDKSLSDIASISSDTWRSIESIKSYSVEREFQYRFEDLLGKLKASMNALSNSQSISSFIAVILIGVFFTSVLFLGMNRVELSLMTSGQLASFFFYLLAMIGSLINVGDTFYGVQDLMNIMKRISKFFDTFASKANMNNASKILDTDNKDGFKKEKMDDLDNFSFKNVHFKYFKSDQISLVDINLSIKKGEKIAIMGLSGSGKTTLLKVIGGIYKPEKGDVLVNNKKLDSASAWQEKLYGNVAFVQQEPIIINDTLRHNIEYFCGKIPQQQIIDLFNELGLEKLTHVLDSNIGDGTSLSGGERQRISIARAILSNKEIIILDEPTSSLDNQNEDKIFSKLCKLNCTVICATHRVSFAKKFDRIVLLNSGRIAEDSAHKDLIKNSDLYKSIYLLQDSKKTS